MSQQLEKSSLVSSIVSMASISDRRKIAYDASLMFWRIVTQIFFREIRPRGAFNIPHDGPVIFVGAPHHNQARTVNSCALNSLCLHASQFLDPLLLSLEVYRETHRRVQFLTAAKSMQRKVVGFLVRLMDSSEPPQYLSWFFSALKMLSSSCRPRSR